MLSKSTICEIANSVPIDIGKKYKIFENKEVRI